ncbi:hypothetical protein KI688_009180 [Linnemannia hyalina]|uniref:Uncharacterized protein n=1 Tax=Linnemannia hyalina TaxID=64524 RepID=A0A9P7XYT7_9FUNG|nr:hypothetical protein KI688_009180 [Linnemannia hyalina]
MLATTITTNATSSLQPPTVETWATGKPKNDRQEHRVGPLPWAAGQDPILESNAGNFPTRQWTNKNGSKANAEIKEPTSHHLQGGSGASSMIGLFYETGPIHVTEDLKLVRNNDTWANEYSMLFVEQPVGTGYSFVDQGGKKRTKRKRGSARRGGERNDDEGDRDGGDDTPGFDANDEEGKGEDGRFEELDAELERDQEEEAAFFATLPSSLPFDFKVAAASKRRRGRAKTGNNTDEDPDTIYTKSGYIKDQRTVVKGMMVFLDQFYERYPEQQKAYLYITGQSYAGKFIPSIAHAIIERNKKFQSKLPQSASRFLDANRFRGKIFNLFRKSTGQLDTFDIRKASHGMNWKPMAALLNQPETKDSLNMFEPRKAYLLQQKVPKEEVARIELGRWDTEYRTDPEVKQAMRVDIMRSTKPLVADLLDNGVKVLAYQGIFDFRDEPAGPAVRTSSKDVLSCIEMYVRVYSSFLATTISEIMTLETLYMSFFTKWDLSQDAFRDIDWITLHWPRLMMIEYYAEAAQYPRQN